jgi:hypothetical protein
MSAVSVAERHISGPGGCIRSKMNHEHQRLTRSAQLNLCLASTVETPDPFGLTAFLAFDHLPSIIAQSKIERNTHPSLLRPKSSRIGDFADRMRERRPGTAALSSHDNKCVFN